MIGHLILYCAAFLTIWLGSGLIVSSIDRFSRTLHLSSFLVSFVILGILTSTPEFAVGLTAVTEGTPEIFVGNLLGGIPVLFLLVVPILAILGNGIELKHELTQSKVLATLGFILTPSLLILDRHISHAEAVILLIMYTTLIFLLQKNRNFLSLQRNTLLMHTTIYSLKDILFLLIGIGLVFVSSQIIVEKTLYFSELLRVSPLFISLLILSLGTNLPELSVAIRSVFLGKKDVAFGAYLGSASANTLLFGVFTLLSQQDVVTNSSFFITFFFITLSLILFFLFSRSNNTISRKEGLLLFLVYLSFVIVELLG